MAAPHVQALCLAQLALLEIDGDDWDVAAILAERARSRVEGCGLAEYPIVALVYAVSALTRSHSGPVADADRDLRTASRLVDQLVDFIPWYEAETRVTLARASLGLSDVAGARSLIAEAARLVRSKPGVPDPPCLGHGGMLTARGGHRLGGRRPHAHRGRAARPPDASDAPLVPRDREAAVRLTEHGQDPRSRAVSQA